MLRSLEERYSASDDPDGATYDLIELAIAAGLQTSTTLQFNVKRINPRLYVGKGQAAEIKERAEAEDAELVVFSVALSPVQQANLVELMGLPVLSRHDLIFSIFEQNAHTAEGKLQVTLAQLKYELPRVVRSYEKLDTISGGIGTIGPGEQLTERIKRVHRDKIHEIGQKMEKMRMQRALRRNRREQSGIFIASIVGFTNVGKSTLLNRLTGSGILVADQYFATLDPTARAMNLPGGEKILLTDTVGFLDDLPPELMDSFRATLEEMQGAKLLIHLADASHPRVESQITSVRKIIGEIGMGDTPELLVFNKADRVEQDIRDAIMGQYPDALIISATSGEGIKALLDEIEGRVGKNTSASR